MSLALRTYKKAAATDRRDQLVLENMALVRHILGRSFANLPSHVDLENLESAGVVGLVQAATAFDPSNGVKFSTFAYRRIHGAIVDELRRNSPLSQEMLARIAAISKIREELSQPATVEILAEKAALTVEEVEEALQAMRFASPEEYTEAAENIGVSRQSATPPELLSRKEQKQALVQAIKALPRKQRLAITLYYLEDLRLKEIGIVLGHSESYISKLLTRAELALRETIQK